MSDENLIEVVKEKTGSPNVLIAYTVSNKWKLVGTGDLNQIVAQIGPKILEIFMSKVAK